VSTKRELLCPRLVVVVAVLIGVCLSAESRAQSAPAPGSLAGAWTLNKELSDKPQTGTPQDDGTDRERRGGGGRMGGGMRGGMRRGGMGRGGMGGDGMNPDEAKRMRDAMRDIMTAPERLTIVPTESMIVITAGDGRVTRLSPDGKKIKDENTGIERRTKWDGGKLVSEVSGLGPGKITETYAIDPEHGQLIVAVATEGSRGPRAIGQRRVYDKS
jgi:hypothetical protein